MRTAEPPVASAADATLEAYLRRVIETQPVCLTRVATDGTFLAVNDAAMALLGAEHLEQIVDTSLLSLVADAQRDECRAFLGRVAAGDRGSLEVELTGLGGLKHSLQIHAVALPGSPDGLAAAFCTFRDVTEHRRLEHALLEASSREERQASALAAERERLNAALAETRRASHAAASAAEQARAAALEAALADAEARLRDAGEQHAARQAQAGADLQAAEQRFEAEITGQLARLIAAESALHEAEGRERTLLAEREAAESRLNAALAEAAAAHDAERKNVAARIISLEQAIRDAEARERGLAAEREEAERAWNAAIAADLAAHEAERTRSEIRIAALEQQVETLEALQAGHAAERQELTATAAAAEAARAGLAAEVADLTTGRQALDAEIRGLGRAARAGRLALALAADLESVLSSASDHGRRLLATLGGDDGARAAIERWLAGTFEAESLARRIRREAHAADGAPARVADVVRRLEPALTTLAGTDIALRVLVGDSDVVVDLTPEQVEQLVLTLVANRRMAMPRGGRASLEVAHVDIDEQCARERAAPPGAYVLIALHVSGTGVDAALPGALFGVPADLEIWRTAGPGLPAILQITQSAGGYAWATREGPDTIAFEMYLPAITGPERS